jgi:hypothetical protein
MSPVVVALTRSVKLMVGRGVEQLILKIIRSFHESKDREVEPVELGKRLTVKSLRKRKRCESNVDNIIMIQQVPLQKNEIKENKIKYNINHKRERVLNDPLILTNHENVTRDRMHCQRHLELYDPSHSGHCCSLLPHLLSPRLRLLHHRRHSSPRSR